MGLGLTASTPSIALRVGGLLGLAVPGLAGALVARTGESVFRGSLFRTGYEIFYTPIPADEKRAAKSIIDVGFDRLGDAVGGGLVRAADPAAGARSSTARSCSRRWRAPRSRSSSRDASARGYIQTLERSLLDRAVELELSDVEDITTRTAVIAHAAHAVHRRPHTRPHDLTTSLTAR